MVDAEWLVVDKKGGQRPAEITLILRDALLAGY